MAMRVSYTITSDSRDTLPITVEATAAGSAVIKQPGAAGRTDTIIVRDHGVLDSLIAALMALKEAP